MKAKHKLLTTSKMLVEVKGLKATNPRRSKDDDLKVSLFFYDVRGPLKKTTSDFVKRKKTSLNNK